MFSSDGGEACLSAEEHPQKSQDALESERQRPPLQNVALVCMKCAEETTMLDSYPAGKNALRRNCNCCIATDKWYSRAAAPPRGKSTSTGESSTMKEAKKVKANIQVLSDEDKKKFYKTEKRKREIESRNSKRSASDPEAFIEQSAVQGTIVDEVDHYVTFRTWATEKVFFRECKDMKEAERVWVLELMKPESKVIERRGQKLLGRFDGVKSTNRDAVLLTTGMKTAQNLHGRDDMEDAEREAETARGRFKRARSSDFDVVDSKEPRVNATDIDGFMDDSFMRKPNNVVASSVIREIEKKLELDKALETDLMLAAQDVAAEKKVVDLVATAAAAAPKIAAVEKISLHATVNKSEDALMDAFSRVRQQGLRGLFSVSVEPTNTTCISDAFLGSCARAMALRRWVGCK